MNIQQLTDAIGQDATINVLEFAQHGFVMNHKTGKYVARCLVEMVKWKREHLGVDIYMNVDMVQSRGCFWGSPMNKFQTPLFTLFDEHNGDSTLIYRVENGKEKDKDKAIFYTSYVKLDKNKEEQVIYESIPVFRDLENFNIYSNEMLFYDNDNQ